MKSEKGIFAQTFDKYLKKKSMTVYDAAKLCNMDRMELYQMVQGQMLPQDWEQAGTIADMLGMSPFERKNFLKAYEKNKIGEEIYYEQKYILEFFEKLKFKEQKRNDDKKGERLSEEKGRDSREIIYGKHSIDKFIYMLLEQQPKNSEIEISLICQPEYEYLYRLLALYCEELRLKICHIICLQESRKMEGKNYNLQSLLWMEPLITGDCDYQVHYYYDQRESHFHNLNVFPYLIMIGNHILQISADYQYALYSSNQESKRLFQMLIADYLKETKPMFVMNPTPIETGELIVETTKNGLKTEIIITSAMDALSIPMETVYECMNKDAEGYEQAKEMSTFLRNRELKEIEDGIVKYKNFFTEEGLRRFLDTGHLEDPGGQIWKEYLEMADRMKILRNMNKQMEDGKIKRYMIRPNKILLPDNFFMSCMDQAAISLLFQRQNKQWCFLLVYEKNLAESFYRFASTLNKTSMVYGRKETKNRIEKIIEEYQTYEETEDKD